MVDHTDHDTPRPTVLLAGGGTAGHVNPLLAVALELQRRRPAAELLVLGTATGLEQRLVPAAGFELVQIPRVPFPRRPSGDMLRFPARMRQAVRAAEAAIDRIDADVVVGYGGFVATPAYLAARNCQVPLVVHHAHPRPGLANKLGARLTNHVAVTFPDTKLAGAQVTGLPLRREIAELDRSAQRAGARAALGIPPDVPLLLVTGGSLGAQRLNEALTRASGQLTAAGAHILHLTGSDKAFDIADQVDTSAHHIMEYLDQMELAYAAADLVLCRSGAGTVAELLAVGLPAIYVPLAIGNGEQRLNAAPVVAAGGAVMISDGELTPDLITATVSELLFDPPLLEDMARKAADFGHRAATAEIADMIEIAATKRRDGH